MQNIELANHFKTATLFTDDERQYILEKCALLKPISYLSGKCFDMLSSTDPEVLTFSSDHEVQFNELLCFKYPYLRSIKDVYVCAINRFARELNLFDEHTITFKIIRVKFSKGYVFKQAWHYDIKADQTMVVLLKNNFKYLDEGKGLDIAFNANEGPHDPNQGNETCSPKDGHFISVKYADTIFLKNVKGDVIHRMSPLSDSETLSNSPERFIIQVKRTDLSWIKGF